MYAHIHVSKQAAWHTYGWSRHTQAYTRSASHTKAGSPPCGSRKSNKDGPVCGADERPPSGTRAESGSGARKVRRARSRTMSRVGRKVKIEKEN